MKIEDEFNGSVYAAIFKDENGCFFYEFCEQYANGMFSQRIRIRQSDLLLAASVDFCPSKIEKGTAAEEYKKDISKFMREIKKQYLDKFIGTKPLNISYVLASLYDHRAKFPIYQNVGKDFTRESLYLRFLEEVNNCTFSGTFPHTAYYALDYDQVRLIAERMGMGAKELLKHLRDNRLL